MNKPTTTAKGDNRRHGRLLPAPAPVVLHPAWEVVVLGLAGALAACAIALVPLPIRVPGHAIVKSALPMAVGVSLAPGVLAGTTSSVAAAACAGFFLAAGVGNLQAAAVVAMLAMGPAIDGAMRNPSRRKSNQAIGSWRRSLIVRLAVAGLAVNLLAFAVRWGAAWWGLDGVRPHMMRTFGPMALGSFALCGVAAGLIAAGILRLLSPSRGPCAPRS